MSRRNLGIIAALLLGIVGMVLPALLFVALWHSRILAGHAFDHGGRTMTALGLTSQIAPIVASVLGVLLVRGRRRLPAGVLLAVATVPFGITALSARNQFGYTLFASGTSIDPVQKASILAEGIADGMVSDVFGALVFAGVALVVVAAASLAPSVAGTPRKERRVLLCGAAWLVASLVVGGLRATMTSPTDVTALMPSFFIVILVAFALVAARTSADPNALVVATVAAVAAALAAQHAFEANVLRNALGAVAGLGFDDATRAEGLVRALAGSGLALVAYATHAVFGTLTFTSAFVTPARRRSVFVAAGFGVLVVAGSAGVAEVRGIAIARLPHPTAPSDILLPLNMTQLAPSDGIIPPSERGRMTKLIVDRNAVLEPPPAECTGTGRFRVYADRGVTLGALQSVVRRNGVCTADLTLVLASSRDSAAERKLGAYRNLVLGLRYLEVTLDTAEQPAPAAFMVEAVDPSTLELSPKCPSCPMTETNTVPFPLPAAIEGLPLHELSSVAYRFRSEDTLEHAVAVISAVESHLTYGVAAEGALRTISIGP